MNDFEVLQVGGKYPPLAGAKECVAITMGENGITIVYNFNRPTETNTIKTIRTIGLGHQFSCDLYDVVQEIKKKPFDKGLYFTAVAMNNHVYSTNDLVKFSSKRWKLRG